MSSGTEIARYRPEHRRTVAVLQTALWGPDVARNELYLDWKYSRNPWAKESRIYLALRAGEAVGMRGFFSSRWEVGAGSRTVAVPLADDLAIRSGDRNAGLIAQIMQPALRDLADSGFEYAFSLSPGLVTTLGSLAQGWRSAGRYDPLAGRGGRSQPRVWLRDRMLHLPLLWRFARSPVLYSADERAPFRWLDAASSRGRGVVIAGQPRGEAMARLVDELGHDGRLRHVRSGEYLAWRFANPLHEYRFLYADGGGSLDGYLVLRARVHAFSPSARVCISDLEGRSDRVRSELLDAAIELGRFAELFAWSSTLRPAERGALIERGFAPADPELAARGCPCLLVRSTRERPAATWELEGYPLLDPASWDLRMLYSMAG